MRCLSIQQPWLWAIIHAGKDIENRSRRLGILPGEWVALHASLAFDHYGLLSLNEDHGISVPMHDILHTRGHILAVARFSGGVLGPDFSGRLCKWYFKGQYGHYIEEVLPLPRPIPHRGMLGLPKLPPHIEVDIVAQLGW